MNGILLKTEFCEDEVLLLIFKDNALNLLPVFPYLTKQKITSPTEVQPRIALNQKHL